MQSRWDGIEGRLIHVPSQQVVRVDRGCACRQSRTIDVIFCGMEWMIAHV